MELRRVQQKRVRTAVGGATSGDHRHDMLTENQSKINQLWSSLWGVLVLIYSQLFSYFHFLEWFIHLENLH